MAKIALHASKYFVAIVSHKNLKKDGSRKASKVFS